MTSSGRLVALGWDDGWRDATRALGGTAGRVVRLDRGWARVVTDAGPVAAALPVGGPSVTTGDWVTVAVSGDDDGQVLGRTDRRTALVRRDPAEEPGPQVLAANIDDVWIVHPADRPLRSGWLDRALVVANGSGAVPIIVVAKADVAAGAAADAADTATTLAPDVDVVSTSAVDGRGIDVLGDRLAGGRTAALLGRSGSGKSSLINAVSGVADQRVGAVRASDARGRHTTTRRALVVAAGGSVIDTPGVRALGLWEAEDGLARTFPEIASVAADCRFRDCSHRVEPGCAVIRALDARTIDEARYRRYITLSD